MEKGEWIFFAFLALQLLSSSSQGIFFCHSLEFYIHVVKNMILILATFMHISSI